MSKRIFKACCSCTNSLVKVGIWNEFSEFKRKKVCRGASVTPCEQPQLIERKQLELPALQTQMWDDGRIFVASAGLLPDCLFVFPLCRWGRTERQECQPYLMLLSQRRPKGGRRGSIRGELSRFVSNIMRDALLEFQCKIKFTKKVLTCHSTSSGTN